MGSIGVKRPPRWQAGIAILALIVLIAAIPDRYFFGPRWVIGGVVVVLVALLAIASLPHGNRPAMRKLEDGAITATICIVALLNLSSLSELVELVVFHPKEVVATRLLASSIAIWVTNIFVFALLYWEMDGGGPDSRGLPGSQPDFIFPQRPGQDVLPNLADYLYLSFSTSTAFSATDTVPVTTRARTALVIQAAASLLTIAITAARAVNILA